MVKAVKGSLIKTEPSLKEIIMRGREDIVIEDIDDKTLFVKTENVNEMKQYIEKIIANATKQLEKND
ncbi:TFIIH complex subunit tfb5 [Conglomerata obtusa]